MSKLLILMMDREYPFTNDSITSSPNIKTQVQETISISQDTRNEVMAKANFIKNLKNKYLIKVQSILEEEETIHLLYQMVENRLKNVLQAASTLLFSKISAQLHQFGRYLSNIGVRILFNIDRIGFTSNQTLKYFMGIDFTWDEDPDEEYLEQFYAKQVDEILFPYMKNHNMQEVQLSNSQSLGEHNKYRKVSYTTLPSKYTRIHKMNEKLKEIQSTPKETQNQHFKRKQSKALTVKKPPYYPMKKEQHWIGNKRKFSGDIKLEPISKFKLIEKDNDIKSEYLRNRVKNKLQVNTQQNIQSQRSTSKTKSRTEQMKQKQYKQMLTKNKEYVKDFVSVLEDTEEMNPSPPQTKSQCNLDVPRKSQFSLKKELSTSFVLQATTQQLQEMAARSIQNSIYIMQRFKSIVYDT